MKYYIVTAACGHVGRGRYIPIDFPIIANDPKEASRICRNIPRVKHGNKKAIINMRLVSKSEYELQCRSNSINPYLTSKNKRECIAAGMDYTDSRSMAELRKRSNWKPKNDKVYESREERSQRKLESYKFNTRLIAKEVEYEVGIAM